MFAKSERHIHSKLWDFLLGGLEGNLKGNDFKGIDSILFNAVCLVHRKNL